MKLLRIIDPDELSTGHAVLLGLLLLALAGNCWLTSAGKPRALPDGARAWNPDSILLAVVEILDLNYVQPTPNGIAVKALVHGVAAGVGLMIVTFCLISRGRALVQAEQEQQIEMTGATSSVGGKRHIQPVIAAQGLMLAFVFWSLLSASWSHAPAFSLGGAVLLATQVAWAFVLGWGLNRRAAVWAAHITLGILAVTAGLALLYHRERNPTLRASYPVGNPLMLAACLLVGVLLALQVLSAGLRDLRARRFGRGSATGLVALVGLALMLDVMRRADSRAASFSLVAGVVAIVFFAGRRWARLLIGVLAVGLVALGGAYLFQQAAADSPAGRDASARVRIHAWGYALDMMQEAPILGNGQGTYALLADGLAASDALSDPTALHARISHAHNEWLEVASELGSVGLVLVLGALLLTLLGGARALTQLNSPAARGVLITLLACLVALIVDATAGVGLRIEGLPLVYYTILGLVWATVQPPAPQPLLRMGRSRSMRGLLGVIGVVLGIMVIESARRDFRGARAMYDTQMALQQGDWDKADALCVEGAALRLSPQRRLLAVLQQARTYLLIAEYQRNLFLRRVAVLQQSESPDPKLIEIAGRSRDLARMYATAGLEVMQQYLNTTSSLFNAGLPIYGLHMVLSDLATAEGDSDTAEANRRGAMEALVRQIDRQPYDANPSVALVAVAGDTLDLETALIYLARPLRYQRLTTFHLDLLKSLAARLDFDATLARLIESGGLPPNADSNGAAPQEDQPWAPELLRLAAVTATLRGDYATAAEKLADAVARYAQQARPVALALATTHAERADALFFAYPERPEDAINAAEEAIKAAPASGSGRDLVTAVRDRLVFYHLAADHEPFARTIIAQRYPKLNDTNLDVFVAQQYAALVFNVLDQALERTPGKVDAWLARSRQLAPDDPTSYVVAAEIALRQKQPDALIEALQQAAQRGVAPEIALEIVERGRQSFPDSETLMQLRESIRARVQQGSAPVDAAPRVLAPPPPTSSDGNSVDPNEPTPAPGP